MPPKNKLNPSFDVTHYGSEEIGPQDRMALIYQIIQNMARDFPNMGCSVSFVGDLLKLTYHCSEINAPQRMKEVEERAKDCMDQTVKYLKSEYKRLSKDGLKLKERKEMADYSIQKTSLNVRYYLNYWRYYDFGKEELPSEKDRFANKVPVDKEQYENGNFMYFAGDPQNKSNKK